jgi:ArsR family transcriptional regulator
MPQRTVYISNHSENDLLKQLEATLLSDETALRIAEFFKALSDPTRVRIISVLAQAELCVGDLCTLLGMSQPAVSQQLRLLRQARLVTVRREGKHVFYTLSDEHIRSVFQQGLDHVQE